ncbi:MAG: autotransporter-associated beta strand repeat-containing protein, partial [Kiritimatiellae bacterium]|nr:autotransporter-associated beta strand repeat-containing protein [Kiritimatiellia bacterium]
VLLLAAQTLYGQTPTNLYWNPNATGGNYDGGGVWDEGTTTNWWDGSIKVTYPDQAPIQNADTSATFAGSGGTVTLNGTPWVEQFTVLSGEYLFTATSGGISFDHASPEPGFTIASGASATFENITVDRHATWNFRGDGALTIGTGATFLKTDASRALNVTDALDLTIDGGSLTTAREIHVGSTSTLTLQSGTVTTDVGNNLGGIQFNGGSGSDATVNLNGGILQTSQIAVDNTSGTKTLNLDGATIEVIDNGLTPGTSFIRGGGLTANMLEGGLTLDTDGTGTVIDQALLHGGALEFDGGLTKEGLGTLTLGGVNTYTGDTVVNGGDLVLADGSEMAFLIGASGVNTQISGDTITLAGLWNIDLNGAGSGIGDNWSIISSASVVYEATFGINGFTEDAPGSWKNGDYVFSEDTGNLIVIPEPTRLVLLLSRMVAFLMVTRRRRR